MIGRGAARLVAFLGGVPALALGCTGDPRSLSGTDQCQAGDMRCNDGFMRETCGADGTWRDTGFVCARAVSVDDETGGYCATKGDGSYRCSGGNVTAALPADAYVRVQASAAGLIGLTAAGQLVAPEMLLAPDVPEVASFRATNMGGQHAVCPLFHDGTFGISIEIDQNHGGPYALLESIDGTFSRALCAYEGLSAGVRTDGSLLWEFDTPPAGNDWTDVALSAAIFCGLRANGEITCMNPFLACGNTGATTCVGPPLPSFPAVGYRSITATAGAACAVSMRGALICRRYDGVPMLDDPGPYTFAEGGQTVLCAIRADGSVACFQHGGNSPLLNSDAKPFVPIDLPFGPDW